MKNILTKTITNNIQEMCEELHIKDYVINKDGSIDIDDNFIYYSRNCKEIPIKINKIYGDFNVSENSLISLINCPRIIMGNFYCQNNMLTSLEHSPLEIGRSFYCHDNEISSLEYCTDKISGILMCSGNMLPDDFYDLYHDMNKNERSIFFKYQNVLGIWDNGSYDNTLAQDLYDDIKDGLL